MDDQAECVQPPENYQSPIDGTIVTTLVSSTYSRRTQITRIQSRTLAALRIQRVRNYWRPTS